jgi:uncharacterized protein (TIGR00297 family)
MASEIGKTAGKVYLITNFERVEPGVSGGVSLKGEVAAAIGSSIAVFTALMLQMIGLRAGAIALLAGFIAIHVDSLLGATLEKKYLTNSGVNFLATLSSGVFCYLLILQ